MNDIDVGQSLPLAGSMRKPLTRLLVLMAIPLVGAIIALTVTHSYSAPLGASYFPAIVLLAPTAILLTALLVVRSLHRAGVFVEQGELVVNTGLGSKRIRLASLRPQGAAIVDLYERSELRPLLRI